MRAGRRSYPLWKDDGKIGQKERNDSQAADDKSETGNLSNLSDLSASSEHAHMAHAKNVRLFRPSRECGAAVAPSIAGRNRRRKRPVYPVAPLLFPPRSSRAMLMLPRGADAGAIG